MWNQSTCGRILDFSTSIMYRNLKFLHMTDFFLHGHRPWVRDKYQNWIMGIQLYSAQSLENVYSAENLEEYSAHLGTSLYSFSSQSIPPQLSITFPFLTLMTFVFYLIIRRVLWLSLILIDDHYNHFVARYLNHPAPMPSSLLGSSFPAKANKFSRCLPIEEWLMTIWIFMMATMTMMMMMQWWWQYRWWWWWRCCGSFLSFSLRTPINSHAVILERKIMLMIPMLWYWCWCWCWCWWYW